MICQIVANMWVCNNTQPTLSEAHFLASTLSPSCAPLRLLSQGHLHGVSHYTASPMPFNASSLVSDTFASSLIFVAFQHLPLCSFFFTLIFVSWHHCYWWR